MDQIIVYVIFGAISLIVGSVLGYYIRQNLAKRRAGTLEAKLQKRVTDVKEETSALVKNAEKKSSEILDKAQKDIDERRREFLKAQPELAATVTNLILA